MGTPIKKISLHTFFPYFMLTLILGLCYYWQLLKGCNAQDSINLAIVMQLDQMDAVY